LRRKRDAPIGACEEAGEEIVEADTFDYFSEALTEGIDSFSEDMDEMPPCLEGSDYGHL
jgi:hypothetical protein